MRVARPDMPVREGELTMTAPIVLATGGHSDTSLCYVRRGEWPAPLCQDTGRWYVHAGATYTRVCDRHLSEVRGLPGFDFARPLPDSSPGRLITFPDACPESRMEDGSHGVSYEYDGRCGWCGEANPPDAQLEAERQLAAESARQRAGKTGQCQKCGEKITMDGTEWRPENKSVVCIAGHYGPHEPMVAD
jgi:hypothetical protein